MSHHHSSPVCKEIFEQAVEADIGYTAEFTSLEESAYRIKREYFGSQSILSSCDMVPIEGTLLVSF